MTIPAQAKVIISAAAGALGGAVMCVLPTAFGYGHPGGHTLDWLIFGWPGVWVFCAAGAGLLTIPLTFLTFALAGPRYSAAAPLARQAYRKANSIHPQPDHDREMGMLAGALAGIFVCASVPPLLAGWSTAPPEASFRGNALAGLLVTGALVAGAVAKLVFLELQRRNPTS
jgi:hypothetical protein